MATIKGSSGMLCGFSVVFVLPTFQIDKAMDLTSPVRSLRWYYCCASEDGDEQPQLGPLRGGDDYRTDLQIMLHAAGDRGRNK